MIVISDTSAITSLIQIQRSEILTQLYSEVVIPTEVAAELGKYHTTLPGFLREVSVTDRARFKDLCREVDPGEAAAITLMLEGRGDLLLIDERRGRMLAEREKLPMIGVLGVLLEAFRRGLISSMAEAISDLETKAGFHISPALRLRVLDAASKRARN